MVETSRTSSSSPASSATACNLKEDDNPSKSHQTPKKRRNLPGMPDPDAEVIALSPKSLQATNKFVCEICNKGFQRDQNLQLHRRGHNLPWKLRQRTTTDVRKRVYVCPEPSCVHHDPSRALGDLTGIKKHFSRKHGDKKFKCDKCSKKYAVLSDLKAHMNTCGTKEYRCDCGTLFSRRDSFVTHRAFCDALAQESARSQTAHQPPSTIPEETAEVAAVQEAASSPPPPPPTPSTGVLSPVLSIQSSAELQENQTSTQISLPPPPPPHATSPTPPPTSATTTAAVTTTSTTSSKPTAAMKRSSTPSSSSNTGILSRNNSIFHNILQNPHHHQACAIIDPITLSLSSSLTAASSSFLQQNPQRQHYHNHYITSAPQQPALSATALLQKAAQIGATSSSSFLRGLGVSASSSNNPSTAVASIGDYNCTSRWGTGDVVKLESGSISMSSSGLQLGLPACSGSSSGFGGFTMGQSGNIFGNNKPAATLDFLGLGGSNETFLGSIDGGLGLAGAELSGGASWNDSSSETKPSML